MLDLLPDASAQCCVTSPPYFGLRNYGHEGQIGLEKTPEAYVASLVSVFSEVWRVLKPDGTLWLNLGDSYCSQGGKHEGREDNQPGVGAASRVWRNGAGRADGVVDKRGQRNRNGNSVPGLKAKDLIGIPWMVAFALRSAGWYLRSDIIWHKPNPMPESVTDRPTRAHEYIFLLTKSAKYYYDAGAIREQASPALIKQVEEGYNGHATKEFASNGVQDGSAVKSRIIDGARKRVDKQRGHSRRHDGFNDRWDGLTKAEQMALGANKRDVWSVAPASFKGAHFATFPPKLIQPCILAGSRPGDVVLDPFLGSGTTAEVALSLGSQVLRHRVEPGIPATDSPASRCALAEACLHIGGFLRVRGPAKDLPVITGETKEERRKRWLKAYRQTPQYRSAREAYMGAYRKTDIYKTAQRSYRQTPSRKKYVKRYQKTPAYKSYRRTPAIKKYQRVYHVSYNQSASGKAVVSKWTKLRKATDPTYKMICCLRVRMYNALRGRSKSGRTLTLLGCTIEHARAHLENQFKPGWCWANHGKVWHIDHIRPLASFKVMDEAEQRVAFHYTNLQPLLGVENVKKGSLYNGVRHTRKKVWTIDDF